MNRMIMAVLAAGLLTGAASGQDVADPAGPHDGNVPSVAVEGAATGQPSAPTVQAGVSIVLLSEMPDDGTRPEMMEDADELAALRASIDDNAAVKAKLAAGGYSVGDVVAMSSNVDGSTIVYVDDRT